MPRPNILLIVIDDLGWTDLTCYGSSFYETPNLDRLASQGVRFTDAYASCPVCSPTRASLLTGRSPASVGITNFIAGNAWGKLMGVPYFHALPKHEVTLAQTLKAHGYHTYHVGKWHLGDTGHEPQDFGFDVNVAGSHWGHPKQGYFSPYHMKYLHDGPKGEYLTDRLTDEALGLLRSHQKGAERADEPFFLNLWHYAVHTPLQAPRHLVEKYEAKARTMGLDQQPAIVEGEPYPCLHKKDRSIERRVIQSDATYAAMIENLDTNLGRLIDELDVMGLGEDTLVLFTSDNGGLSTAEGSPTCNAPLSEGKGWMYDGGNRVCQIARWPGTVPADAICLEPVSSIDIFPTCLDAGGIALSEEWGVEGESLMELLRDPLAGPLKRDGLYWHYPHYSNQGGTPACAVRDGDLKLIEFFEDNRIELYDLSSDIGETNNLAEQRSADARRLHHQLKAWRNSVEAKIPRVNTQYQEMLAGTVPCPDGKGIIPGSDHDF